MKKIILVTTLIVLATVQIPSRVFPETVPRLCNFFRSTIRNIINYPTTLKQKHLDKEFATTITRDDLQKIFQLMFGTWSNGFSGSHIAKSKKPDRPIYIIENEFIDKSFSIHHKYGTELAILNQSEFNNLKRADKIIGYTKIAEIFYIEIMIPVNPRDLLATKIQ